MRTKNGFILLLCLTASNIMSQEPGFLTRNEILLDLSKPEPLLEKTLDADAQERLKNLIPHDKLLPPGELSEIESGVKSGLVEGVPENAPKQVDLRHRSTPVKSQWNGTCTAFGLTAGLENTLQRDARIPGLDLSEPHFWSKYRQYSAIAALGVYSKNPGARIGDQKDFPVGGSAGKNLNPHARVNRTTYIGDNGGAMVSALMSGKVVYLALATPRQMIQCNKTINTSTGKTGGGHAVLVEGYMLDDARNPIAVIKNSWGANCGDRGYQYMDLRVCKKSGFYCNMWVIDEVHSTVSGSPVPAPLPAPNPLPVPAPSRVKTCKRLWYAPWKTVCSYSPGV